LVSGALPLVCKLCATASAFDSVAGAGAAAGVSDGTGDGATGSLGAVAPVELDADGLGDSEGVELAFAVGSVVEVEIDGDAEDELLEIGVGAIVDCAAADVLVSGGLLQAAKARAAVSKRPVKETFLTTAPDSCDWKSKSDSHVRKVLSLENHGEHLADLGVPNRLKNRVQTWLRSFVHDFPTT
jgi:hypothetical protein